MLTMFMAGVISGVLVVLLIVAIVTIYEKKLTDIPSRSEMFLELVELQKLLHHVVMSNLLPTGETVLESALASDISFAAEKLDGMIERTTQEDFESKLDEEPDAPDGGKR